MATKKTISSKFVTVPKKYGGKKSGTHEVELAYITAEEAEKLKRLDMHNSGIGKEMHYGPKGIPNYDGDAGGGDYGDDDDEGGGGDEEGGGGDERDPETLCNAKDGYTWDVITNSCIKDEEVDTEESCNKKGGGWSWNSTTNTCDYDDTWEKADPYKVSPEKDRLGKPGSETERVKAKRDIGTPFAESVAASLKGEVQDLGAKSAELAGIDISREAQDEQLAAAQQWAAKGMSFSTPMLHAEEDMIRDLSRRRLINADQALAMQSKLDLAAWNASEPIQKLAAASKLGATEEQGGFQPGAIDISQLMEKDFGITVPGFSGLPKNISQTFEDYNEDPLYPSAENITDPAGNRCDYDELDDAGYCPVTA